MSLSAKTTTSRLTKDGADSFTICWMIHPRTMSARAGPDLPETPLEPPDPDRSRGRQLHVPPREHALDRHDAAPAARQRGEEPDVGPGDDQDVLDVRGKEAVDTAAQLARQLEVTAIADGDDGDVAGVECLPHAGTVGRASAPRAGAAKGCPDLGRDPRPPGWSVDASPRGSRDTCGRHAERPTRHPLELGDSAEHLVALAAGVHPEHLGARSAALRGRPGTTARSSPGQLAALQHVHGVPVPGRYAEQPDEVAEETSDRRRRASGRRRRDPTARRAQAGWRRPRPRAACSCAAGRARSRRIIRVERVEHREPAGQQPQHARRTARPGPTTPSPSGRSRCVTGVPA